MVESSQPLSVTHEGEGGGTMNKSRRLWVCWLIAALLLGACGSGASEGAGLADPVGGESSDGSDPVADPSETTFYGSSIEEVCLDPAVLSGPALPAPESYALLEGPQEGWLYCLGPARFGAEVLEAVSADGPAINLVFLEGDGIAQFNALAAICARPLDADNSDTCPPSGTDAVAAQPRGSVAIVLDGVILSAPLINSSEFNRAEIVISGSFSDVEAQQLTDEILLAMVSPTNVLEFRPVIFNVPPGFDDFDLDPNVLPEDG